MKIVYNYKILLTKLVEKNHKIGKRHRESECSQHSQGELASSVASKPNSSKTPTYFEM